MLCSLLVFRHAAALTGKPQLFRWEPDVKFAFDEAKKLHQLLSGYC